jgi:hypothetical protein
MTDRGPQCVHHRAFVSHDDRRRRVAAFGHQHAAGVQQWLSVPAHHNAIGNFSIEERAALGA